MTTSITQRIAQARYKSQVEAHRAALRPFFLSHPAVAEALRSLPAPVRKLANVASSEYTNAVFISVTLYGLRSLRDARLTRVLERFSDISWHATTRDYTFGDQPNRDYEFERLVPVALPASNAHVRWLDKHEHHVPISFSLYIRVNAYVKSDSPTCRVVVTGVTERVVREEVKEIVCA
jgi:hypothetical protein